ncbi:MAG TPA: DUF5666 domain-containing protein [Thermoanaerobaculia bacterium]|jgi:uncharacterized protein (DUF2141 family)|nr:DUF5666 domain-containing protein [Thermoanaerobaculia bacterium]
MPRFLKTTSLAIATVALALALAAGNAAAAEKTLTATGTVSKLDAAQRTIVVAVTDGPETTFAWTADTKINGTLAPGAKVTIRYTTLPDGQNLAHQISVSRS